MNVLLGITGGIAAYKAPDLVRRLRERGADVQVVMTASAEEFVTATALQAVSGRQLRSNLWDKDAEAAMSHIGLKILILPMMLLEPSKIGATIDTRNESTVRYGHRHAPP